MLRAPLIRDQVIQVRQPREKRLLTAPRMMESLHHEELPLDGVMRLIEQRTGHGHLWVFKDGIPACFLGLKSLAHTVAVGLPCGVGDMGGKVA
jgi:hypothetical protein